MAARPSIRRSALRDPRNSPVDWSLALDSNSSGSESDRCICKGSRMIANRVPASRLVLFVGLIVVGLCRRPRNQELDFLPAWNAVPKHPIVLVPGVFSLTTSLNDGALFGLGQGMTRVFTVLSTMAAIGIFYWLFFAGAGRDTWLTVALAFLMAGIFGNLYDRLGLPGMIWQPPSPGWPGRACSARLAPFRSSKIGFDWPVFNLADSMLVLAGVHVVLACRLARTASSRGRMSGGRGRRRAPLDCVLRQAQPSPDPHCLRCAEIPPRNI